MSPDCPDIRELIERGSLGTPEAKAIRASVPREQVERVLAMARELEARQCSCELDDSCPVHGQWEGFPDHNGIVH